MRLHTYTYRGVSFTEGAILFRHVSYSNCEQTNFFLSHFTRCPFKCLNESEKSSLFTTCRTALLDYGAPWTDGTRKRSRKKQV